MSKTEYIKIRVSDDEKEAIKNKALKRGMSVSEYLRFLTIRDEVADLPKTAVEKMDEDTLSSWIKSGLI